MDIRRPGFRFLSSTLSHVTRAIPKSVGRLEIKVIFHIIRFIYDRGISTGDTREMEYLE